MSGLWKIRSGVSTEIVEAESLAEALSIYHSHVCQPGTLEGDDEPWTPEDQADLEADAEPLEILRIAGEILKGGSK